MLIDSLKRLEATVEAETEALSANAALDLDAVNRAKSRSLLELTRLARGLDESPLANVVDTNYSAVTKIAKALLPAAAAYGGVHRHLREQARSL